MVFEDLISYLTVNKKSGKDRFKFHGNVEELKEFVKFVLNVEGQWNAGKDTNLIVFKSKCKQLVINFWKSTKTVTLNGKMREKIKNFYQNVALLAHPFAVKVFKMADEWRLSC